MFGYWQQVVLTNEQDEIILTWVGGHCREQAMRHALLPFMERLHFCEELHRPVRVGLDLRALQVGCTLHAALLPVACKPRRRVEKYTEANLFKKLLPGLNVGLAQEA